MGHYCQPVCFPTASNVDPLPYAEEKKLESVGTKVLDGYTFDHNGWWTNHGNSFAVTDVDGCKELCDQDDHCVAFNYNRERKICYKYPCNKGSKVDEEGYWGKRHNDAYTKCAAWGTCT